MILAANDSTVGRSKALFLWGVEGADREGRKERFIKDVVGREVERIAAVHVSHHYFLYFPYRLHLNQGQLGHAIQILIFTFHGTAQPSLFQQGERKLVGCLFPIIPCN